MEDEEEIKQKQVQSKAEASGSWWPTWGQEWIESVKEKSAYTLELVKKDLHEFVDVIQGDTSVAISETATKMEESVKENSPEPEDSTKKIIKRSVAGLSKLLHSVSELMAIEPDDTQEEFITLSDDKFLSQGYDRKQEKLRAIQTDPGTYCNEPEGLYGDWLKVFNLDDHKTDMSDLLVQNPEVRVIYTQLVPNVVSHTTFWQRYFYRVLLLEAEEKRRAELLSRANDTSGKDERGGGWGDDDENGEDIVVVTPSADAAVANTVEDGNTEENENSQILEPEIIKIETSKDESIQHKDTVTIGNLDEPTIIPMSAVRQESTDPMVGSFDVPSNEVGSLNITERYSNLSTENESAKSLDVDEIHSSIDSECKTLNKSCDTISTVTVFGEGLCMDKTLPEMKTKGTINSILQMVQDSDRKNEYSETSSLSSWISIDDDMKVKKIKGEQEMKGESNDDSEGKSSHSSNESKSSEVIVNKSDADGLGEDDDFDLELDDDVNDEELAKMVEEMKNKTESIQDEDDDWENWE